MTQPKPEAKPKALAAKLAEITEAVGRVPKNGRNDFHKYDYVTEADLVKAVRGEMAKRQIVLIPAAFDATRDGSLTTLRMLFTFLDGESGEVFEAQWFGTGEDKGDKGLYKAYTGALKYFLMKTFLIATGDDPERDTGTTKTAPTKKAAASSGNGEVSAADVIQARLDNNVDPETFAMLVASVGADSPQAATPEQRAEIITELVKARPA